MIISKPNIKYSLEEIVGMDIAGRSVLIIGPPASGKTFLCNQLAKKTNAHKVIHCDDFIVYGFEQSMYEIWGVACTSVLPTLIEGMQGFRLLRKGAETNSYLPQIVVQIEVSRAKREEIYRRERNPNKIKYLKAFEANCQAVLEVYYALMENRNDKPEWINFYNSY